jgi:ABC-type amino acid transport substrate-binding protein
MPNRLLVALGRTGVAVGVVVASVLVAACGGGNTQGSTSQPKCNNLGTLTSGTITVSIQSYMPYSGLDNNRKLTGLDGDILTMAANNLGCKLSVSVTDFPGTLAAVQARRADMTLGSIGWTAVRAQGGIFTDPPYYSPISMIEKKGTHIATLSQLEGKPIGTQPATLTIPAIKAVPGATLKTYATNAAAIDDVVAGRIAVYIADPLIEAFAVKTNPSLDIELDYLTPPTDAELAAHPDYKYFQPYMTGFYIAKSETALEKVLTEQILSFYKNGTEARLVSQWGADPKSFLTPLPRFTTERVGMDRPEGWQAPSAAG